MIHRTKKVLIKCCSGGQVVNRVGCELRMPEFDSCSEQALFSREPVALKFVWQQRPQKKNGGFKKITSARHIKHYFWKKSSISQPILFTIGPHEITAKEASCQ